MPKRITPSLQARFPYEPTLPMYKINPRKRLWQIRSKRQEKEENIGEEISTPEEKAKWREISKEK